MELLKEIFGVELNCNEWDKQSELPLYIAGSYKFMSAVLNDCRFIILTPTEELVTLPALKKQIKKIQEIENVPVVIKLSAITSFRKKNFIENRIPFITNKQAFLPFLGAVLSKEDDEPKEITKFMFSTQLLVLLFIYNNADKLYCSEAVKQLPFTPMTLSRAVKQLESVDLFKITKDGVNKIIETEYCCEELYEKIKGYLSSPVCKVGYLKKADLKENMVYAGETALAEETMLNPSKLLTYAVYVKEFDKNLLMNELIDSEQQVRIELWEYDPRRFAKGNTADKISVALSFEDSNDERIEEAVEEFLKGVWKN